jgi:hypothetical protein
MALASGETHGVGGALDAIPRFQVSSSKSGEAPEPYSLAMTAQNEIR